MPALCETSYPYVILSLITPAEHPFAQHGILGPGEGEAFSKANFPGRI